MWKDICNKLVNLEYLEEQFVEYYGETHREEIHNKLQQTTIAFSIQNLNAFIKQINSRYIYKIFNNNLAQNAYSLYKLCPRLIDIYNKGDESLLNNEKTLNIFGYDVNDIIQISKTGEYIHGPKYKEFKAKLLRAKFMIESNQTDELKAYESSKEQFKKLITETQNNIDLSILDNIIKNEEDFKELVTSMNSIQEWENSICSFMYLDKFNKCFETDFKSLEELKNDANFYEIAQIVEHIGNEHRKYLNILEKMEDRLYIPNNNTTEKQFIKIKNTKLPFTSDGQEWMYSENILNTNNKNLKYNVLIPINERTSYSTLIHELTHVMHSHLIRIIPIAGFHLKENSRAFNEIVTEFLAVQMTKKINLELPINKFSSSKYSNAFGIMEDFLVKNEELLKECQFAQNPPKMLAENIGLINYKKLVSLTNRFLRFNPSSYINQIVQETGNVYTDAKDLLKDIDILYGHFKNNRKISEFLKTVKSLHELSCELSKTHSSNLVQI